MIRHSLIYFLIRAISGIFSIGMLAVFTRLMSPMEYGKYALGLAVATIASSVLFQWLNVAVARFYPVCRDTPETLMNAANKGYLLATGITTLVFIVLLPFYRDFGVDVGLIVIIFLITLGLGRYNMILQLANAQMTPTYYGLLSLIKGGVALAAGWLLVLGGVAEQGALIGLLIALIVALLTFEFKKETRTVSSHRNDSHLISEMLRYGIPLTLVFVSIMVVDMADRLMIGWLLGASQAGPYSAAYDLTQQTIGVIMNVLFLAAFPATVYALEKEGDAAAHRRLYSMGRAMINIGVPSTCGFAVLSPEIAQIIFGEGFRQEAAKIMPWIAFAILVGTYKSFYLDTVFQLRCVTRYQAYIAFVMALANVAMNYLLLPRYGTLGAAWSTLGAFTLGAAMSWWVGRKLFPLPALGSDIIRSGCASAAMVLALFMLPTLSGTAGLIIRASVAALVFAGIAYVINLGDSRKWFRRMLCHLYRLLR